MNLKKTLTTERKISVTSILCIIGNPISSILTSSINESWKIKQEHYLDQGCKIVQINIDDYVSPGVAEDRCGCNHCNKLDHSVYSRY
jgi:hypothetical protein